MACSVASEDNEGSAFGYTHQLTGITDKSILTSVTEPPRAATIRDLGTDHVFRARARLADAGSQRVAHLPVRATAAIELSRITTPIDRRCRATREPGRGTKHHVIFRRALHIRWEHAHVRWRAHVGLGLHIQLGPDTPHTAITDELTEPRLLCRARLPGARIRARVGDVTRRRRGEEKDQ